MPGRSCAGLVLPGNGEWRVSCLRAAAGSGLVTRVTLNLDGNGDSVEKHTNNLLNFYY